MISSQYTQHNVKGISKAVRPLTITYVYTCILKMTKITETSAAYFPPYVFASSVFFVQKEQMISVKIHMAHN